MDESYPYMSSKLPDNGHKILVFKQCAHQCFIIWKPLNPQYNCNLPIVLLVHSVLTALLWKISVNACIDSVLMIHCDVDVGSSYSVILLSQVKVTKKSKS